MYKNSGKTKLSPAIDDKRYFFHIKCINFSFQKESKLLNWNQAKMTKFKMTYKVTNLERVSGILYKQRI